MSGPESKQAYNATAPLLLVLRFYHHPQVAAVPSLPPTTVGLMGSPLVRAGWADASHYSGCFCVLRLARAVNRLRQDIGPRSSHHGSAWGLNAPPLRQTAVPAGRWAGGNAYLSWVRWSSGCGLEWVDCVNL